MAKVPVTFNRNVKFGTDRYKKGSNLSVSKQDYEDLLKANLVDAVEVESEKEDVIYFSSSREELSKVKNDDLKAFLDANELEFESNFTKEQLINVILGDEA